MNNKSSSKKTTIWALVIIAAVGLAYFWYSGSSSTPSPSIVATNASDAVGAQVLGLLNQIQSLKIDTSIFNDPGYKTLRDYSVLIPPVSVGRPNPFAPLPGVPSSATGATH